MSRDPGKSSAWQWDAPSDTTISPKMAANLGTSITTIPPDVKPHGRVQRILDQRVKMASGEVEMDWGFAETMAYASLLDEGHNVRLVGQDSGRGTFFHRHAVIHNQLNSREYIPLEHVVDRDGAFRVIDSFLSEVTGCACPGMVSACIKEKFLATQLPTVVFAHTTKRFPSFTVK